VAGHVREVDHTHPAFRNCPAHHSSTQPLGGQIQRIYSTLPTWRDTCAKSIIRTPHFGTAPPTTAAHNSQQRTQFTSQRTQFTSQRTQFTSQRTQFTSQRTQFTSRALNSHNRGVNSHHRGVNSHHRGVNSHHRGVNSHHRGVNSHHAKLVGLD
jgi:hypothetical protein